MSELRITPIDNGAGLTLLVNGTNVPAAGTQVQRIKPALDPALMDAFHRSQLTPAELAQLSNDVTNWLIDAQLRGILNGALPANGVGLRLIFVVPDNLRPLVASVPFELLDGPHNPLILQNNVQSLAYLLSKTRVPPAPATSSWPFKALIIRSSPPDLDRVPEAEPIRAEILALGNHYGPRMVSVDVISSEPAVGRPATWQAVWDHLERTSDYNVLVYLGHGELQPSAGGELIGQLLLESEDGQGHLPVGAPQLARLLADHPINTVVLAGCYTALDPAVTSRRAGAELGVAQALVNSSEAGVQIAVAMRTELHTNAAELFLKAFFKSLLDITPDPQGNRPAGHIDRAVRAARARLFANPLPPSWATPIVLRATEREPFLEFLANPIKFTLTDRMSMLLESRTALCTGLADYSLAAGMPDLLRGQKAALDGLRTLIRTEGLRIGPLLLPHDVTVGPGQAQEATVELAGALTVSVLRGRISAPPGAAITQLAVPAGVSAGFQLVLDPGQPDWFELRSRAAGGAPAILPAGDLLRATVQVDGGTPSGVYPLGMEVLEMQPPGMLWPGDGVLLVPNP